MTARAINVQVCREVIRLDGVPPWISDKRAAQLLELARDAGFVCRRGAQWRTLRNYLERRYLLTKEEASCSSQP